MGRAEDDVSQLVKYKWQQSRHPGVRHHSQSVAKGSDASLRLGFGTSAFPFVPDRNERQKNPTKKSLRYSMKDTKKDFSLTEAFCVNFGFLVNMLQ